MTHRDGALHSKYEIYLDLCNWSIFLFKYVKHWIRNEMILRFIKSTMILMLLYIIMSLVVSNDPIESILKLLNFFIPLILIVVYVSLIKR